MNVFKLASRMALLGAVAIAIVACDEPSEPLPTATPAGVVAVIPAPTPEPTSTPSPTPTATPEPTSTPTLTPTPTATPEPTSTLTPTARTTSQPTATPIAQPTLWPLITMQGAPNYVKWKIGSGVKPEYVEDSVEGVRLMDEYIESLDVPGIEAEVHFHLFQDQHELAAAYEAATGAKASRGDIEAFLDGEGYIFVNTLRLEEWKVSSEFVRRASAHEMVHALQYELAGVRYDTDDHTIAETGPFWVIEGIAEFLAYQAMAAAGVLSYDTIRNSTDSFGIVEQSKRDDTPLSEMETLAGSSEVRGNPWIYFLLAAELLASRTGQSSLIHYYSLLQPGTTWQEAFEQAFGVTAEEFYELFEAHRAADFPDPNRPTPTATPKPEPVAHPSDILDWFADPPDDKHSFAAKSIERIWDRHPDLAAGVARLIWVGDGITWNEEFVLEELSYVVSEDPELVRAVVNQEHRSYLLEVGSGSAERAADYPWLADGMNARELYAIIEIARIAKRNPGFAERVLGYTWLADGITEAEARGLGALSRWALLTPELVDRVLKYSWLDDGITDAENDTLSVLYSFAERGGIEATKQVMDYQWLADGVTWEEYDLIAELAQLIEDDPEAAIQISRRTLVPYLLGLVSESGEQAADYPWLADGVNAMELRAIIGIAVIAKDNPSFSERVWSYSWLADGITEAEARGLGALSRWALLAPELVDRVLKYSWLDDGITDAENETLSVLYSFAERGGIEATKQVMDYQWLADGVTWEEVWVIDYLRRLVEDDPEAARQISRGTLELYLLGLVSDSARQAADYPWLADGLDARELRAIIEIARIAKRNPGFAELVLGYTWLADGITEAEARGLGALSRWALLAPELVDRVLKYSWLDDGITDAENETLSVLYSFAERGGIEATKQVMDYQWLADGVTWEEYDLIAELGNL